MKLFIELCLDEDVSVLLVKLLRARGFKVIATLHSVRRETCHARV